MPQRWRRDEDTVEIRYNIPDPTHPLVALVFGKDSEPKAVRHQVLYREFARAAHGRAVNSAAWGIHATVRDRPREVVILRGPPGLGKSTLSNRELSRLQVPGFGDVSASQGSPIELDRALAARLLHVCSTDDFFTRIGENRAEQYHFNFKKIGQHHQRNQERVKLSMELGITPLYVDNTNMSWWEMSGYVQLADVAGYTVRIVEPHELCQEWDSIEFLAERNKAREAAGKMLDVSILQRMVDNFQPLPHDERSRWLPLIRACHRSPPMYIGISVQEALQSPGESCTALRTLWAALKESLEGIVEGWESSLDAYNIPAPLHVTTFFGKELTGPRLADSAINDGQDIQVEIEALAFLPSHLACAVVRQTVPTVPAAPGKLLHVTMATRAPWKAVHSNDLLHALSQAQEAASCRETQREGDVDGVEKVAPAIEQHGPYLKVFRNLQVAGYPCEEAVLLNLEQPLIVKGSRYRHFSK